MQVSERDDFIKLLAGASELYGKEMSKVLVRLYWQVLQTYSLADVSKAFESHFSNPDNGQFMPKPADLIRAMKGNSQTQSLQAWSKVAEAIRLVGPYQSVVFDEPYIHIVVQDMGGWVKICRTSEREFPFVAKEFQTRYTHTQHQAPNTYPKMLTGLTEHQNMLDGYEVPSPYLLGNTQQAQAILENGNNATSLNKISYLIPKLKCLPNGGTDARTTKIISQAKCGIS